MSAAVTMANFSAEMTSPVETMSTTHGPAVAATLARVFRDVWTASLDGPLETATCTCATPTHPSVAARVDFLGDWRGEIALCLPEALATHVGATMFMMPPEDLSDADVRDAVGELCNMVGGNIRAALSPTCEMGTPHVFACPDGVWSTRYTEQVASAHFIARAHLVRVALFQGEAEACPVPQPQEPS